MIPAIVIFGSCIAGFCAMPYNLDLATCLFAAAPLTIFGASAFDIG